MPVVTIALITMATLCSLPVSLWSQTQGSDPVRLVVLLDSPTITVGQTVNVTAQLKDLRNQTAKARKDYWIYVEVRDRTTAIWSRSVLIRTGTDSQQLAIPIDRVGVFMIKALNAQLREGATFVNVKPKRTLGMDQGTRFGSSRWIPIRWQPPPPRPDSDQGQTEITIRSSDEGSKLMADGNEAATVSAFLTGPVVPFDIALRFFCSRGALQPNPVVIRGGEDHGEMHLTSKESGLANIELINIDPRGRVKVEPWTKSVQFLQPIAKARVLPKRTEISLADSPEEVQVELLGLDEKEVKPDEPVLVTVTVNSRGNIDPGTLTLTREEFVKSVKFAPRQRGQAVVTATPFGAEPGQAVIEVVVPWSVLMATMAGGFLGGLGSLLGKRLKGYGAAVLRALLGVFTALVFYWAIQSGLIHVSPATVSNALLALLASLLAGYVGTKLIDVIWKSVSQVA